MVIGLLLIAVAAAMGAWGAMRLAAANPTSRLPFWGWPPNRPFGAGGGNACTAHPELSCIARRAPPAADPEFDLTLGQQVGA